MDVQMLPVLCMEMYIKTNGLLAFSLAPNRIYLDFLLKKEEIKLNIYGHCLFTEAHLLSCCSCE